MLLYDGIHVPAEILDYFKESEEMNSVEDYKTALVNELTLATPAFSSTYSDDLSNENTSFDALSQLPPSSSLDENESTLIKKEAEASGKDSSLTIIFGVWNGLVGSGLVILPWAYSETGLILGVVVTLIAFIISFITQYFVMICAGNDRDFTDTLYKIFGRKGWFMSIILFIFTLFFVMIVYFMLLS